MTLRPGDDIPHDEYMINTSCPPKRDAQQYPCKVLLGGVRRGTQRRLGSAFNCILILFRKKHQVQRSKCLRSNARDSKVAKKELYERFFLIEKFAGQILFQIESLERKMTLFAKKVSKKDLYG